MIKYYSDETKKFYQSVQELQAAEKALATKREADEAARVKARQEREEADKKRSQERKADADRVKKAYDYAQARFDEAEKAKNEYHKVLREFCSKYGAYHSTTTINDNIDKIFNSFFGWLW